MIDKYPKDAINFKRKKRFPIELIMLFIAVLGILYYNLK